jgi:hypothetical protein
MDVDPGLLNLEFDGVRFAGWVTNDEREGLFVELRDEDLVPVLEVFYSDETDKMTLTAFRSAIPLEAVEWVTHAARTRLPPSMRRGFALPL